MLHKKTFTKKAPDIFGIQVRDFSILDIFYKIQNLKKWKMKAVVSFLPRNLKLHSSWHNDMTTNLGWMTGVTTTMCGGLGDLRKTMRWVGQPLSNTSPNLTGVEFTTSPSSRLSSSITSTTDSYSNLRKSK